MSTQSRDVPFLRMLTRPLRRLEPLDVPVERFLASVRFEQRGKLDQLGIEIGSLDKKSHC